jgi:hypothetical protein
MGSQDCNVTTRTASVNCAEVSSPAHETDDAAHSEQLRQETQRTPQVPQETDDAAHGEQLGQGTQRTPQVPQFIPLDDHPNRRNRSINTSTLPTTL